MKKVIGFLVMLSVIVVSCSKAPKLSSSSQVSCKLDGKSVSYQTGSVYIEDHEVSMNTDLNFNSKATYSSSIGDFQNSINIFNFKKGILSFQGVRASDASFLAFFAKGSSSFDGSNGFQLEYIDEIGKYWSTGLGSQVGSSIEIADVEEASINGTYAVKVLLKFNCKLYNGGGSTKTIKDGYYVAHFVNMN